MYPESSNKPNLLTSREVARRLGIDVSAFSTMRAAGYGPRPVMQAGRSYLYHPADVDAWIAEQKRLNRQGG